MLKMSCGVINCSNSTHKLKKWKQEICYEHNDFYSTCKREDCSHCIRDVKPFYKLDIKNFTLPSYESP